jgi:tetratricopeptide (TPR) repeat protein
VGALEAPAGAWAPGSLQAIIAARLDTLLVEQKALLQDASVVGKVFWPGAVSFVGGSDDERVREALHELMQKDLVRPVRASSVRDETEYSFAHALIRDVAYGQIPRLARAEKHVRVAGWLERMAGDRVSDHAELLAHHYGVALELTRSAGSTEDVAGLEEATRRQWMVAGERAMAIDASRAEACFDSALALLPPEHPDRAEALARKGEAAVDAGRYEDAQRAYEEAVGLFRERDDLVRVGSCLDRLANVLWERGDTAGCRLRLAEAVEVLEAEPPGAELATCYASLASDRLVTGHFREAIEWSERSLELVETLGVGELRPSGLSYRGMARCYLGDLGGLDDLREALHVAQRRGLSRASAQVLLILAEVLWAVESPTRALETAREGADLAERRGLVDVLQSCRTLSLGPLFDLGRWDELLRVADEVVGRSRDSGGGYTAALAQPWSVQVLVWRGAPEQAAARSSRFVGQALGIRDAQVTVPATVAAALVAVHTGRNDEAGRLVEELEGGTEVTIDWYREQFLADLLRICVAIGDLGLARRLLDRAKAYTVRHRLSLLSGRAVLEEALGHLDEAARIHDEAAEGWTRYGHELETGMALLGAGRCVAPTDPAGSRDRLGRARAIFARLGAEPLVAEADRAPNPGA